MSRNFIRFAIPQSFRKAIPQGHSAFYFHRCGSRFRLISRLFGCLKCLLLLIVRHIPEIRNDHPSLVVKVGKFFCKNTKNCSAILSAIFLRSVMTTHSPPPLNHAPAIFDELQTSLCFPFPGCR